MLGVDYGALEVFLALEVGRIWSVVVVITAAHHQEVAAELFGFTAVFGGYCPG